MYLLLQYVSLRKCPHTTHKKLYNQIQEGLNTCPTTFPITYTYLSNMIGRMERHRSVQSTIREYRFHILKCSLPYFKLSSLSSRILLPVGQKPPHLQTYKTHTTHQNTCLGHFDDSIKILFNFY